MKFIILFVVLCSAQVSFAVETFSIPFANGEVFLTGQIAETNLNKGFYVDSVHIKAPGSVSSNLYLVSEFGWGDEPYDFLCETISKAKYGTDDYKYASAYGFAETFGLFSGVLFAPEFFIVNRDKTFSISESYPNASYDSGFGCFNYPTEY